ncbi:DUF3993 domain-containing protein [Sutcliffiella halmapala]|uniref:DUF3993 domain-containing protein n=1 Tax=Sutcliffiella halmapala TaxID=79882 RepID=UPI000994E865|nr:DUF3993 domain-containing protein [Sutcliffiella halmapala]
MQKKWTKLLFALIIILLFGIPNVAAETPPSDEEVYSFLQEAQQAQFSLGEKHRSLAEIQEILDPYFTRDYQRQFLDAHLFEEAQGYITYGTDFTIFYIPFFTFDVETKIHRVEATDTIFAYEFFEVDESMPYLYENHYEYVELKVTDQGFKVVGYGSEKEKPYFLAEGNKAITERLSTERFQTADVVINRNESTVIGEKLFHTNEDLQKGKQDLLSFYQINKPFAVATLYNGTQYSAFSFFQSLPMFVSQLFSVSTDSHVSIIR